MNQVYFYELEKIKEEYGNRLNPFMNQVYFYNEFGDRVISKLYCKSLNPFMNQVYFYDGTGLRIQAGGAGVLIPL